MRNRNTFFAIMLFSVVVRVFASIYLGNQVISLPGTADQLSYHALALRVLDGHGFTFGIDWWPSTRAGEPTAHWSFIYTLYLTIVYAIFDKSPLIARLIQACVVGILQPLLTYWLARRLFDDNVGLIGAALNAIYPYFIYYSATLMTEAFYITAILAIFYLSIRIVDETGKMRGYQLHRKYVLLTILLGLCLGLAVTLRQLFLIIIPFIYLWIWYTIGAKRARASIFTIFITLTIILLNVIPFTIYNYTRFHRFVLLNTNAGYAFFLGNHPIHGTHFISASDMENYQDLFPPALLPLDEASMEQALLREGIKFVIDDPIRYLLLSISRIPDYFKFWPSPESTWVSNFTRISSFGLLFPFMLYGCILWIHDQRGRRMVDVFRAPGFLMLIFSLIYTSIHVLTWTSVRYRLPIDAVMIVFSAYGVAGFFEWFRAKTSIDRGSKTHEYQGH